MFISLQSANSVFDTKPAPATSQPGVFFSHNKSVLATARRTVYFYARVHTSWKFGTPELAFPLSWLHDMSCSCYSARLSKSKFLTATVLIKIWIVFFSYSTKICSFCLWKNNKVSGNILQSQMCQPYSLVVIKASVASEVLGSTSLGANILGFNGVVHSVVDDVPVDSERLCLVATSSISKICRLSLRKCSQRYGCV